MRAEKPPPESPRSPRDLWLKGSEGQDEQLLTIPRCQRLPDERWGCSSSQRPQGPQVGGKHYLVPEWEQTATRGCFRVGTRMRWGRRPPSEQTLSTGAWGAVSISRLLGELLRVLWRNKPGCVFICRERFTIRCWLMWLWRLRSPVAYRLQAGDCRRLVV